GSPPTPSLVSVDADVTEMQAGIEASVVAMHVAPGYKSMGGSRVATIVHLSGLLGFGPNPRHRVPRRSHHGSVKVREGHLRVEGSSLFEELATWDLGQSKITAYRNVIAELEAIDQKVIAELEAIDQKLGIDTKFAQLARWRTADHLVVMTPAGLLRPREVPSGWGLVEVDPRALKKHWEPVAGDPLPCVTRVAPSHLGTPEPRRLRLLRNLAVAACRGVGYGLIAPPTEKNAADAPPATEPSLFSPETTNPSDTISPDNLPR
ncbi:MAG: hypothetical protein RL354_2610, partial [Planctomycetota bacterium]